MENIIITKIYRSNKDKQGNPLMGKNGRPYERLAIQTQEYGSSWLSGFSGSWNQYWKEGTRLEIGRDIELTRVHKDGKEYLNFSRVDRLAILEKRIVEIEARLNAIHAIFIDKKPNNENLMGATQPTVSPPTSVYTKEDLPPDELNPDDIPL